MFDEKYHDRSDAFSARMERLGGLMEPSPKLMQAAKSGVPLRPGGIKYTAATHVRKFTKAVVAYAVGIALLLGAILLLPRLFSEQTPVGTEPSETTATTATTETNPPIDRDEITNPEKYTDLEIKVRKAIWAIIKNTVRKELTINDISLLGNFVFECDEAMICFYLGCPGPAPEFMFSEETVLGYQFDYSTTTQLKVIANGGIHTLQGAYDAGILIEEEIRSLWEAYTGNQAEVPETKECDHEYISSENVPTCTEGCTVEHSCIKCGYSYNEWLDALGHAVSGGVCIRCGVEEGQLGTEDCEHRYSEVFHDGICTICGEECQHDYTREICDAICTICGKHLGHDYETSTSTEQICTEGTLTTTTCSRCGYSYTENTPAMGHSYNSTNRCTVCGEAKKVISVTDPNVTAGAVSLLPDQMYLTYPDLSADDFYWMDPTSTPCFYNVYTYFAGYTITDIRLPVYYAEKGDVMTVRVVKTNKGYNTDVVATYKLTATRKMNREWVLFTGLSINVPEGCTLTFGWMDDTISLMYLASDHIPGYSFCNDYRGFCGGAPLIMDIYGRKTGSAVEPEACTHMKVVDPAVAPTCSSTGLTEGAHCGVCGTVLIEQKTIARTAHSYGQTVVTPTCGKDGYTLHQCDCGNSYQTDAVSKTWAHTFENATITGVDEYGEPFQTSGKVCSTCKLEVVVSGNADGSWFVERAVKYYITNSSSGRELVIYGEGAMPDYEENDYAPWHYELTAVVKITIADGITSVGSYAFCNSNNRITEVVMGKDVKILKRNSMSGLSLSQLKLGEGVETIEAGALNYSAASSIYWPKALKYVDSVPALVPIYYQGTQDEFDSIQVSAWNQYISMKEFNAQSPIQISPICNTWY